MALLLPDARGLGSAISGLDAQIRPDAGQRNLVYAVKLQLFALGRGVGFYKDIAVAAVHLPALKLQIVLIEEAQAVPIIVPRSCSAFAIAILPKRAATGVELLGPIWAAIKGEIERFAFAHRLEIFRADDVFCQCRGAEHCQYQREPKHCV